MKKHIYLPPALRFTLSRSSSKESIPEKENVRPHKENYTISERKCIVRIQYIVSLFFIITKGTFVHLHQSLQKKLDWKPQQKTTYIWGQRLFLRKKFLIFFLNLTNCHVRYNSIPVRYCTVRK